MQAITLSESAVAVLRFRIRGHKLPVTPQRLPAFEELAEAGIVEADGDDYRIVDEAGAGELLAEQEERLAREEYPPPDADLVLSESARGLLRACIAGGIPEGDESNRPAFRELVKARIMMPMGSFSKGDECVFRWTYWGYKMRSELAESPTRGGRLSSGPTVPATPVASLPQSPAPAR